MTNLTRIGFLVSLVIILAAAFLTHRGINGAPGEYGLNLPFYLLLLSLVIFTAADPAYPNALRGIQEKLTAEQDAEANANRPEKERPMREAMQSERERQRPEWWATAEKSRVRKALVPGLPHCRALWDDQWRLCSSKPLAQL